jgi:hypothetical protein
MKTENIFNGDLTTKAGEVYPYTEINGNLSASVYKTAEAFNAAFPSLEKVGGYLYLSSLTDAKGLKLPQSIGGSLDLRSLTDAKGLKLPQSIGGSLDLRSLTDAQQKEITTKTNDPDVRSRCRALLMSSFAAAGFSFADGILARIVSQRGPVTKVIICGKTEVSYIVTDGEAHSHGKTLEEARDGLLYKIGSRDKSEFQSWTLDKVVTKRDAIRAYRTITGACEGGVRAWMETRQTPESVSVKEIIKLTKGAYGSQEFAGFFKAEKVAA